MSKGDNFANGALVTRAGNAKKIVRRVKWYIRKCTGTA